MSKVVFVGNVPYNMGEDALIDVFKSVGQVVGFRLVFDRDTGKPKGYGFCEFADHETAMSAVRNLNNVDVGGRPLRIDLADSDPFLEGKTTVRGEIIDGLGGDSRPPPHWRDRDRDGPPRGGGGKERERDPNAFMGNVPAGKPVPPGTNSLDMITQNLATMNPAQLVEVLAQMKAFVITHPEQARALLIAHPQLDYALFQALLLNKIVDPAILQRMLAATVGAAPAPAPAPVPPPPAPIYPYGQHPHTSFPPPNVPGYPPAPGIGPNVPPPSALYPPLQQQQQQAPPPHIYYRPPVPGGPPPPGLGQQQHQPPQPPAHMQVQQTQQQQQRPPAAPPAAPAQAPAAGGMDAQQRAMLLQVLNLTPDQIAALPQAERDAVQSVRNQFMGVVV